MVDQQTEDNQQLRVYYQGQAVSSNQLRDYLSLDLPHYMLPTDFIQVQAFALRHSGKIDRIALPQPQRSKLLKATFNKPQTQTQSLVLEIWREVLQRNDIGIEDNFFDLGGHSLLLMQVFNCLQQKSILVQTVDLFRYPTVAKLATYIDGADLGIVDDTVKRAEKKAQRQKINREKRRLGRVR